MAQPTTPRLLTLDEVRASVKRVQAEGEKFVGQLREDARALIDRASRPDLAAIRSQLQERAEDVLKQIQSRRTQLTGRVEELLTRLTEIVVGALKVVRQEQLDELTRRLARLERKLDELGKEKTTKAA